jgi:YegS/Rv2252/BmrU family lipid kinase
MSDTLFIINPVASRGTTLSRWKSAKAQFVHSGLRFDERFTSVSGEAEGITGEAMRSGYRKIIAVGGDGTLNEVVNGYLKITDPVTRSAVSLGLLPSGTGSDFRRSVGLSRIADAIRAIRQSETRLLDAMEVRYQNPHGKTQSRFAINLASFGLGGEVVQRVNHWRHRLPRWIGGRARFIAGAVGALSQYRLKPVSVRLEDGLEIGIESNLIIVANGRFAGSGMMFAPHAQLDDGLLDVILTDEATRFDVVKELPRIFHGGYLKSRRVSAYKAKSVSISASEKLALDIDGEAAGFAPAQISVLPSAIHFIC